MKTEIGQLEKEMVQRRKLLKEELLAMKLTPAYIKRLIAVYGTLYKMVCSDDVRKYSHKKFLTRYMENGALDSFGKRKSKEWFDWHFKEFVGCLNKLESLPEIINRNKKLLAENERMKNELVCLRAQYISQSRLLAEYMTMDIGPSYPKGLPDDKCSVQDPVDETPSILDTPCAEVDFSVRVQKLLRNAGIVTLGGLILFSREEMMQFRGMGKCSLDEIEYILDIYGLSLTPEQTGLD